MYRFTEFYVDEPQNATDLCVIIHDYLKNESPSTALVEGVVRYVHTFMNIYLQLSRERTNNCTQTSVCLVCQIHYVV